MFKKITILKYFILFSVPGFLIQGCNIINPKEKTPTYIHIDSFQFANNQSSDIKCVWVYYDNNPIGVFDLPATIPVVASGTKSLLISPGILINGQNNLLAPYPFYTSDTSTLTAQPGKIINYTPHTGYYSDVKVTNIANFQDNHLGFSRWDGTVDIKLLTTLNADSLVYQGGPSGGIFLNAATHDTLSVDSTDNSFIIPENTTAFIEFDYNTTAPLYVGLQANLSNIISSTPYFLAGIKPNGRWQKFYLRVSDFAGQYRGDSYNFYIKAVLEGDQPSGRMLIDNIKLVTF